MSLRLARRYVPPMIVEYIRYAVTGSQSEALIAAYEVAGKSLKESVHCLGFELSRCHEAPDSLILRILWDSLDGHLQGFRASPEFKRFFEAIKPFVSNIQEMRHYVPTASWTRS
jgi:quinol monooxygenase YgiN